MYLEIEHFDDYTEWTASDPTIILSNDDIKYFDDGSSVKSLKIYTPENMSGKTIEKTLSSAVDISNYNELRLQISSRTNYGYKFVKAEDFSISMELSLTGQPEIYKWYIPIQELSHFNCINFDISAIDSFDKIVFRIETDMMETFWIDYMIAYTPELEFDALTGITGVLDRTIEVEIGNLSAAATAGDSSITLSDINYIAANSLIKIIEGANTEYHQVDENPINSVVSFTELNDGTTLLNSFTTSAIIYLVIPASFTNVSKELYLPSFTIWGFNPVLNRERGTAASDYYDYVKDSDIKVSKRNNDLSYDFEVQITCESWNLEILQMMNQKIREFFYDDSFFQINGVPIQYEITDSGFDFGMNEESPHISNFILNLWVFERYADGVQYALSKTTTQTVTSQSTEDL